MMVVGGKKGVSWGELVLFTFSEAKWDTIYYVIYHVSAASRLPNRA
jgi:hypothetical protein